MNTRIFYHLLILLLLPSLFVCIKKNIIQDKSVLITIGSSIAAYILARTAIPAAAASHIKRGLFGIDINKPHEDPPKKVAESMGLYSCGAFLLALVITSPWSPAKSDLYPALVSVIITTLLGFADDVLDIRWRYKVIIPLFTVLPLVLDYRGSTTICFHGFLQPIRSLLPSIFSDECINVGYLYHLFIALMTVFCTHSINIYAGINGLEAGQSLIVACFLLWHSLYYWNTNDQAKAAAQILLPFIMSTFALLHFNWFPSKVFVGDTFTLTAGATIGAAAILGHFSEMTLLFMLPQLLNFLLSLPQLLGFIKCPRHRLPKRDDKTGKLYGIKTNLNVVNYWLLIFGPKTEDRLCVELLIFQIVCCLFAYVIKFFYNYSLTP